MSPIDFFLYIVALAGGVLALALVVGVCVLAWTFVVGMLKRRTP